MSDDTRYMEQMGELLVFHKIINLPEELTGDNFEALVMEFQEKVDILDDGKVGPETLWYLQYPWVMQAQKLLFVKCEADKVPGSQGYDYYLLREDAAERYRAIRNEVVEQGGLITSAGGKRPLGEGAGTGRSATSMHYTGLAFDLATDSGFFRPDTDPFVVTRGDDGYWEIWCRASRGEDRELEAVYWTGWNGGIDKEKTVEGKFINFTGICGKHGFYPIRPRSSFTRSVNRKYISSEWWHFQANDLLIPKLSQFGIELLKIEDYTPEHIQVTNEHAWSRRRAIYQKTWF